jgi:tetratricopeptide (TPR) repeat protein
MNIDAYSSCPCHQGKKIRFCCGKEIAADLNQIASLSVAGQDLAALDEIERAMGRHGDKECLLTMKIRLLLGRKEYEAAERDNELILQKYPQNTTAMYHRGLIQIFENKLTEAVDSLQNALEMNPSDEIPGGFSSGFRILGIGLISEGHLIAGRAHLLFASLLKNHEDANLRALYRETFVISECPLFLKHNLGLTAVPPDQVNEEWAKKYRTVCRASERGQFRKALKYLRKIDQEFPGQPVLIRGIAVLLLYLGTDPPGIRDAWLRVRDLKEISLHDRIEAEAIAQYFSDFETDPRGAATGEEDTVLKIEIPVERFGDLTEKCFSDPLLIAEPQAMHPIEDGSPPPRNRFLILNHSLVKAEELTVDNLSMICGSVLLFGRQTDREARIEIYTKRSTRDQVLSKILKSRIGEFWTGDPVETKLESIPFSPFPELDIQVYSPEGLGIERYHEILAEKLKGVILEWAESPNFLLDGQSPRQAVQNPDLLPTLEWILAEVQFDSALAFDVEDEIVSQIRSALELADLPLVKLDQLEINDLSITQLNHVDFTELSDQQLDRLFQAALRRRMITLVRRLAFEIISRSDGDYHSLLACYSLLAQTSASFDQGLEYFAKARAVSREEEVPVGRLLVQELEFRIRNGRMDKVPELFDNIRLHHMHEPEVEEMLQRLFTRMNQHEEAGSEKSDWQPGTDYPSIQQDQPASQLSVDSVSGSTNPTGKLWIPE